MQQYGFWTTNGLNPKNPDAALLLVLYAGLSALVAGGVLAWSRRATGPDERSEKF